MLSFTKGTPIAIVKGGKFNNQIIYVDNEENAKGLDTNPLEILEDVFKNENVNNFSREELRMLKNSMSSENDIVDSSIYDIIENVKGKARDLSKKEFKIFDDGRLQPLPRFNKTERCYITGQTECGKSYYCKKYLEQLRKVHPTKKIYVFSDVDSDPELDCIKNLTRFKLDEELAEKENGINPAVFKDSICLFDDIDSIQNSKVYKFVLALRDSLLRRGRHEDISVLCTNHLATDYKNTRILLNECNSITIFCRSGSTYGIKYLLKKYVGMDKKQTQKVLNLPSRWVTIYKNYPQYVAYEKGLYLI